MLPRTNERLVKEFMNKERRIAFHVHSRLLTIRVHWTKTVGSRIMKWALLGCVFVVSSRISSQLCTLVNLPITQITSPFSAKFSVIQLPRTTNFGSTGNSLCSNNYSFITNWGFPFMLFSTVSKILSKGHSNSSKLSVD